MGHCVTLFCLCVYLVNYFTTTIGKYRFEALNVSFYLKNPVLYCLYRNCEPTAYFYVACKLWKLLQIHQTWICFFNIILGWMLLEGVAKNRPDFIDFYGGVGFLQLWILSISNAYLLTMSLYSLMNVLSVFIIGNHFLLCLVSYRQDLSKNSTDKKSVIITV